MVRCSFLSKSCFRAVLLLVLSGESWAVGGGHAPWMGMSHAGHPCSGSNVANYGPYDYVNRKDMLRVVENAHFMPRVQNLTGSGKAAGPTSDLDYTLKVIPNHHLALNSTMQFHALQLGEYQRLKKEEQQTGYRLKKKLKAANEWSTSPSS
jgi:hypothetical protein